MKRKELMKANADGDFDLSKSLIADIEELQTRDQNNPPFSITVSEIAERLDAGDSARTVLKEDLAANIAKSTNELKLSLTSALDTLRTDTEAAATLAAQAVDSKFAAATATRDTKVKMLENKIASLETKLTTVTASQLAESKARTAADSSFTKSLLAESKSRTTADAAFTKELKPLKPFATFDTNSFLRKLTNIPNPGRNAQKTYNWPDLFNKLFLDGKKKGTTVFQSGATYVLVATSSNGVHSHTYTMNLRIGGTSYGGVKYRYRISNVKQANGPWRGGCGSNPFNSINDNYMRILGNACNEAINLWISRIG